MQGPRWVGRKGRKGKGSSGWTDLWVTEGKVMKKKMKKMNRMRKRQCQYQCRHEEHEDIMIYTQDVLCRERRKGEVEGRWGGRGCV